jgi:hypothetical protein
MDTED